MRFLQFTKFYALLLSILVVTTAPRLQAETWTSKYPRFAGIGPSTELEEKTRGFFEGTVFKEVILDSPGIKEAIPKIRELVKEAGAQFGLSFIITEADYPGYSKPLHLKLRNLTLASLVDQLATQGEFYWDFSNGGKLTLHPRPADQPNIRYR